MIMRTKRTLPPHPHSHEGNRLFRYLKGPLIIIFRIDAPESFYFIYEALLENENKTS